MTLRMALCMASSKITTNGARSFCEGVNGFVAVVFLFLIVSVTALIAGLAVVAVRFLFLSAQHQLSVSFGAMIADYKECNDNRQTMMGSSSE